MRTKRPPHPDGEAGYGLAVVIILAVVMSVLATTAFMATRNTQLDSREQRNITSARGVADGGAEKMIYELSLTGSQWDDYVDETFTGTLGEGTWTATITAPTGSTRLVTVVGEYPTGSGDTIEVEVELVQTSPAAFDYAMFADEGITIHHHGSTWLAPRVLSDGGVHTNGDAALDASSEYEVNLFRAVGTIDMDDTASRSGHSRLAYGGVAAPGGGDVPFGNSDFGTGGYTWRYDIGNGDLCYPGAIEHGDPGHNTDHTVAGNGCDDEDRYFGGVLITGPVEAGGLRMGSHSVVDGDVAVDDDGDYDVEDGTITGAEARSTEPPASIDFPSLDYETTYLPRAEAQESTATCPVGPPKTLNCGMQHVFSSDDAFYSTITDPGAGHDGNGLYRNADHSVWRGNPSDDDEPAYILAAGDWYIEGGIEFDLESISNAMDDHGVPYTGGPPPVVVAGSLITPDGGMTMKGRLYVVGRGNATDFIDDSQPRGVDMDVFLSDSPESGFTVVEPGVLAAGGSIDGKDLDDDSSWETSSSLEADLSNATWIRGLVYSGSWDDGSQTSEAEGQHWHNYDPKNQVRIFGAQVGGKLHNCNNFEFTYDDVVTNAFGFTSDSGTVQVVSWDER